MTKKRSTAYTRSGTVALILGILTIIEYYIAIHFNSVVALMLIALLKGVAVLQYFMHVSRLWNPEGDH